MSGLAFLQDDEGSNVTQSPKIAVAVSGGADSMALLHMLHARQTPEQKLIALTVDHGLRPDSACEAQAVAAYCATLDIPHHILPWLGDKPQTGLQATARKARRHLLLDKCRELGIADLSLAHQADDQVETILQRLARGAGPQGLGGMKATIVQRGVTIHRPLLHVRRHALRHYCRQHDIPFHDDPSNDDTAYERIRWRQIVTEIERTRPDFSMGVARSARRLHDAAQAIDTIAADWRLRHQTDSDGVILLPRPELATQPCAVIVSILRQITPPDKAHHASLERLENWVAQAFVSGTPTENALTLGGWWLQLKKNHLTVRPAPERRNQS